MVYFAFARSAFQQGTVQRLPVRQGDVSSALISSGSEAAHTGYITGLIQRRPDKEALAT